MTKLNTTADVAEELTIELEINPKFQQLCKPLSEQERIQLEENLLRDGVLDAIKVWNGRIVDGHNRYAIATDRDIPFEVHEMDFESEEEALDWIATNQLGRRNITPQFASYLRGKKYHLEKESHGNSQRFNLDLCSEDGEPGGESGAQADGDTAAQVAAETGVSRSTVKRDAKKSKQVDALAAPLRDRYLSGDLKLPSEVLQAMSKLDHEQQLELDKTVSVGDHPDHAEAVSCLLHQSGKSNPKVDPKTGGDGTAVIGARIDSQANALTKELAKFAKAKGILNCPAHKECIAGLSTFLDAFEEMRRVGGVETKRQVNPKTGSDGSALLASQVETQLFGPLIRAVDSFARATGTSRGQYHKSCLASLNTFLETFQAYSGKHGGTR